MGVELPSTLVFDYPTVTAMAAFLAAKVAASQAAGGEDNGASLASWASDDDVSIASLALSAGGVLQQLRLVGVAEMVVKTAGDALLGAQPVDQIRQIPVDRWDLQAQEEMCAGLPIQVRFASSTPSPCVTGS